MPTQKLLERKALIVGIVINVLQVLAGMAVFFMTGLKAMFLDFSFTAISVLSGMVAVYLSSRTVRTTERFPNGMFALEPIYAICKAIFTMSLLVYSLIDVCRVAYDYFVFGSGERIETGPVVIYEILTVIVCTRITGAPTDPSAIPAPCSPPSARARWSTDRCRSASA